MHKYRHEKQTQKAPVSKTQERGAVTWYSVLNNGVKAWIIHENGQKHHYVTTSQRAELPSSDLLPH